MKIPYMALRFPEKDIQTWGLQISRSIRRNRELNQWQYVPPDVQNFVSYYGKLEGIQSIKSPIRLSFTFLLMLYLKFPLTFAICFRIFKLIYHVFILGKTGLHNGLILISIHLVNMISMNHVHQA